MTFKWFDMLLSDTRPIVNQRNKHVEEFERDSRGLILKCKQTIAVRNTANDFGTKTFTMTYDDAGNVTSMTYPSTRLVDFNNYNSIELLGDITTNGFTTTKLMEYDYDGYRIAEKTYGNNYELHVGYDTVKRIKTFLHKNTSDNNKTYLGFTEDYDKVYNKRVEIFLDDNLLGQ